MNIRLLKRRSAAIAATLVSAGLVLGACSSDDSDDAATSANSSEGDVRIVKADNGDIEVPAEPERVAALGDPLSYLELGGKPIAVTELSDKTLKELTPDQRKAYDGAVIVGQGGELDIENVAQQNPDLILATCPPDSCGDMSDKYSTVAPTVLRDITRDTMEGLAVVAEATGKSDVLNGQKEKYESKISSIAERYGSQLDDLGVAIAYRYEGQDENRFMFNGSYCNTYLEDSGLVHMDEANGSVPFENISMLSNYGIILYPGDEQGNADKNMNKLMSTTAWKSLPAVTAGNAKPMYCRQAPSYVSGFQFMESFDRALSESLESK